MEDANKSIKRSLDHLADMQEGEKFTMVPRCLSDAWLNGELRMPDMKFKLLFCLMSHGPGFKVKASYLRNRFHPKTIKKYIKELETEGYIRVEKIAMEKGGFENIHHVNSVTLWDVKKTPTDRSPVNVRQDDEAAETECSPVNVRQVDECSPMNSSPVNSSPVNTLNETDPNQTEVNETNQNPGDVSRASSQGVLRVTFDELDGAMRGLYDQYTSRDSIKAVVRAMAKVRSKQAVLAVIETQRKSLNGLMKWQITHPDIWMEKLLAKDFEEPYVVSQQEQKQSRYDYEPMTGLDDTRMPH